MVCGHELRHTEGMDEQQPPGGISVEDWQATPEAVRRLVLALLATVEQLQQEVARLGEQVNQNSQNSTRPPSSDPPSVKRKAAAKKGERKRGGQPGHRGKGRPLKPPEEVSRFVISRPTSCAGCGALLLGEDPQPSRRQVTELPRIEPEVIEYQAHSLRCLACGQETCGAWPAEMPAGSFGPRLQATTGYLSGRFGISRRDTQEVLATLFQVEMGLGSVPAQEQRLSNALAEPVREAEDFLRQQPVVNVDETSWQEANQTCWLWVGSTPAVTVFQLHHTRGNEGVKRLIGADYAGIVGSDRWSAYNWLEAPQRQLCWSHLRRDFQALVERGGDSALIGRLLLAQVEQMFALWHQMQTDSLSRPAFQEAMQPIRREVEALLAMGVLAVKHAKTRATCGNILKYMQALWTFVDQESVAPTNNAAERALRRPVIWRRRSFGTQSEAGSRFVERIQTAVTSLRQQHRDVLTFLTQACQAAISGADPPSLLPAL
jgi:transposase